MNNSTYEQTRNAFITTHLFSIIAEESLLLRKRLSSALGKPIEVSLFNLVQLHLITSGLVDLYIEYTKCHTFASIEARYRNDVTEAMRTLENAILESKEYVDFFKVG